MFLCSYECGVYWAWLPSNAVRHTTCTLVHIVVTQVGILQFSNDVRVELLPQLVDLQVYQKTLQTMVSSRGQLCCSLLATPRAFHLCHHLAMRHGTSGIEAPCTVQF